MVKKKALLVGINDYRKVSGAGNLRGCLNDIQMMSNTLTRFFDFKPHNIRMLADSRATKGNIISRLKWLVQGLEPGDVAMFHYSGHGTLMALRDDRGRVIDRHHPIVCTYDLDWDNPLSYDEVGNLLVAPDGVNITSVMDCCHSGHDFQADGTAVKPVVRHRPTGRRRGIAVEEDLDIMNRFIQPPVDIAHRSATFGSRAIPVPMQRRGASESNDILLCGSHERQTSADAYIKGTYRGAFTYCLNEAMAQAKYNIDYVNLIARTGELLRQQKFTQRPQLEGSMKLSRWPVFGTDSVKRSVEPPKENDDENSSD